MSYTREQWSRAILTELGNTTPDIHVVQWLVSWTVFETSSGTGAAYNLLNTTEQYTPGVVSNFNSAGVKNYDTFAHGIQANVKVLRNGYYPTILHALSSNNFSTFTLWNDVNRELSTWGTGQKANDIYYMSGHMGDEFPGTLTSPVQVADALWTKFLSNLPAFTGIYSVWLLDKAAYGSPLSKELEIVAPSLLVSQEFEHCTFFWINGVAHVRLYPVLA